MLFRPKYCANCGEKIDRVEWGILTSRRFCPVCEIEFKGHEMIPRVVVGLGVLIGIFGFGSYLNSGTPKRAPDDRELQAMRLIDRGQTSPREIEKRKSDQAEKPPQTPGADEVKQAIAEPPIAIKTPGPKPVIVEQGYFCGAETKKGTPCSRRVKGNVRCYQHPGMPAMVAAEKLRIN
jgi:hypothetical protein